MENKVVDTYGMNDTTYVAHLPVILHLNKWTLYEETFDESLKFLAHGM